ncbi:MAG: metal ABC transporter permease [Limisphaerales bacterium]
MNSLIPPFDFQRVFLVPWAQDAALNGWVLLMGFLVTTACGLAGVYLVLRRLALMGDAISHSVLPGLAGAFLIGSLLAGGGPGTGHGARSPGLMFLGALIAGLVTTVLVEFIHRRSRIKQDAAIGITFSTLFALGVVLITAFADHVDLDPDCVLYGEIGFVAFADFVRLGGRELAPEPVALMAAVALLTTLFVLLFYKELLLTSFDPGLATAAGIPAGVVHYALMGWLGVVVVSAFEAVGAILVIAMLILPGATGLLLTRRLPAILLLVPAQAALSALLGLHLALWLDCSTAAAMVVAGCGLFLLAWLVGPESGWRRWRARLRAAREVWSDTAALDPAGPVR